MSKYQELIKDLESEYNYLVDKAKNLRNEYEVHDHSCKIYLENITKYEKAREENRAQHSRDLFDKARLEREVAEYREDDFKNSARAIKKILDKAREENNNG